MTSEPPEHQSGMAELPEASGLATVVPIDSREEISSICGRVDAAPTFAVVIHAPRGNRALSSELGMRRLQRHAEDTGKVIAIATGASALAARSRQLGVPVSRRPEQVRWDSGGRRVLRIGRRAVVLPRVSGYFQGAVVLAVAGAAMGLAVTMAPSATVTVSPPVETLTRAITITASPDRDAIDFAGLRLPAREVSASQHLVLAVRTTGTVAVDTTPAHTRVTITNTGATDVLVPARSVLLAGTNAPRFELDAEVRVPPGKSADAAATATRPGPAGNVPAAAIFAWQEQRFGSLTVTNPEPATGGASELRPAVDGADLAAIRQLADDLARSEALKRTLLEARAHDAVFLQTARTSVQPREPSAVAGAPADLLLLPVDISVVALAISADALEAVARRVLEPAPDTGEFVPGSFSAVETGARQFSADTNSITTEILVKGDYARTVTREALKDAVKGASPEDARSTLASRYGIQDAQVSVSPGWAPWLPRFGFRIVVELRSRPPERDATARGSSNNDAAPAPTATAASPSPGR